MEIKCGARYNLRDAVDEVREGPSFDREFMEVASSYESEETSSSDDETEPTSSNNKLTDEERIQADHLRILAEAVQKLKAKNEKLLWENDELTRETKDLRAKLGDELEEATIEAFGQEIGKSGSEVQNDKEQDLQKAITDVVNSLIEAEEGTTPYSGTPYSGSLSSQSSESSEFLQVSVAASTIESPTTQNQEVSNLHKTIDENNTAINALSARITELLDLDEENQRAMGLLKAKISEQQDTIDRINKNKQDVLDQLEAKRVGMLDLEKELKGTYHEHGDYIRKIKDLEISVADRTFLAAELRRELNDAQDEKVKILENRERDIQAIVTKRMYAIEKHIYKKAEEKMREVQQREMDVMANELLAVEQKAREMRMKLGDGSFVQKYQPSDDAHALVKATNSLDSHEEKNSVRPEGLTSWSIARTSSSSSSSSSVFVPAVPDLITNLNELKSALAFGEKINKMTVAAIKKKVLMASKKVDMLKNSYENPRKRNAALSKKNSSTSDVTKEVINSISQEWESYYQEKKQEQDALKSTLEREVAHFAQSIRKNTFLLGGFTDDN